MQQRSTAFLSCDWGTSSFRLRLVDATSLTVLEKEESEAGIAATFRNWQNHKSASRLEHYGAVLQEHITQLEAKVGYALRTIPLILSGMASASIGLQELPYGSLPLDKTGRGLVVEPLLLQPFLPNPALLVSGVSSGNDVMRGEETQLLGWLQSQQAGSATVIIPGTHAKHISVTNGVVTGFATYMTGEFFQLLAQHSILAASVGASGEKDGSDQKSFLDGVREGSRTNLLQAAFGVRINQVLRHMEPRNNYQYLSGLLIGAELRELASCMETGVCIMGNATQASRYALALEHLFPQLQIRKMDADAALVMGHRLLFRTHFANL